MRHTREGTWGQNVAFFTPTRGRTRDWKPQELAEFYRVENALMQGGMRVITDCGVSDEGDPWFVFCREDDGEPIVHFARFDGQYVIATAAYEGVARGLDFRSMVQELISRHKLAPTDDDKRSNIRIHPSALLIVLVGMAFFKTASQAQAGEAEKHAEPLAGLGARSFSPMSHAGAPAMNGDQSQTDQNFNRYIWFVASSAVASAASSELDAPVGLVLPDVLSLDLGHLYGAAGRSSLWPSPAQASVVADTQLDSQPIMEVAASAANIFSSSDQTFFQTIGLAADQSHISLAHQSISFVGFDPTAKAAAATPIFSASESDSPISLKNFMDSGILLKSVPDGGGLLLSSAHPNAALGAQLAASNGAPSISLDGAARNTAFSSGNGYHEDGIVVDQLPANLRNAASYASVSTQQPGSAASFLTQNKITVSLHTDGGAAGDGAMLLSANNPSQQPGSSASEAANSHFLTGTAHIGAPAAAASGGETVSTAVFGKALDAFLEETPSVHVMVSHGHYVFASAEGGGPGGLLSESVTMTFVDGSSISIVGQPQALYEIITHVNSPI